MIAHILISVKKIEESLYFFRDIIGMNVLSKHPLESESIQKLWGLPYGTEGEAVFLKNDEQTTLICLIEFYSNARKPVREFANTYDYGLFDIAFRAKSVDAVYQKFKKEGYRFLSPPVIYTAEWAKVTVKEVIMIGPNEMPIAFIERLSEPKPIIKGDFGTMVDSAQFVEDIDSVSPYYTEILGLKKVFDSWLPKGLVNDVLAFPPNVDSRMAFLVKPEAQSPAVELIQCTIKGNYLLAKPPDIGLFALSWEVESLSDLTQRIKEKNYPTPGPPIEFHFGPHGRIRMVTAEGPNKVLFQYFERLKDGEE